MSIFDKLSHPVVFKESVATQQKIDKLTELLETASPEMRNIIEKDINIYNYGLIGEKNILFELKNSHLPIYILHDLHCEHNGLSAQIDFLVVTRKQTIVIECKNLIGDIEINSSGDFIRSYTYKGRKIKEGIYSPLTQNQRHLDLVKAIRISMASNFIKKMAIEKYFNVNYKSVVVLSNPKTIVNFKYSKKDVKSQVIRADQLISYIKNLQKDNELANSSDNDMLKRAQRFLDMHIERDMDLSKYNETIQEHNTQETKDVITKNDDDIRETLKAFRLEASRKEGIKAYCIFSNNQMDDIIEKRPTCIDELMQVSGFGTVKCEKYGESIIRCFE